MSTAHFVCQTYFPTEVTSTKWSPSRNILRTWQLVRPLSGASMPFNYIQLVNFSSAMSWFQHHWWSFSFCSNVFGTQTPVSIVKNHFEIEAMPTLVSHDETEIHYAHDNCTNSIRIISICFVSHFNRWVKVILMNSFRCSV